MSEFAFPMRAHRRGHPLVLFADRRWRWAESGRFMRRLAHPAEDRDCAACGLPPTPEGYDACIGHVPGAVAACCGHGTADPYVLWQDRTGASGERVPWRNRDCVRVPAEPDDTTARSDDQQQRRAPF